MRSPRILLFLTIMQLIGMNVSFAQTKSISDRYLEIGNTKKAIEGYKKDYNAQISRSAKELRAYLVARAYALDGKKDSTFRYLSIAYASNNSVKVLRDPAFYYFWEGDTWNAFANNVILKSENNHGKYKDLDTSRKLWRMRAEWEVLSYNSNVAKLSGLGESSISRFFDRIKDRLQREQYVFLEHYVTENGWPKNSQLGKNATLTAAMIVYQGSKEQIEKYLPYIKESCIHNETSWYLYAYIYDRLCVYNDQPQKYGTQLVDIDGVHKGLYRVENRDKINDYRADMGLTTVEKYLLYGDDIWAAY
ncbi:hypothetical protein K5X82_02555 [Halosquirtibacter xylanolyticus]|uniref:hypothetical protein n=1 Tax=Halosquirtibacter xylanolyticus TaxID=3374599 RepID=UPI003747EC96|nr:hypothetical protein K5X82_02555 [Prolixibacteraceae bacterium]